MNARTETPCLVEPDDTRPSKVPLSGRAGWEECGYCDRVVGATHAPDCVIPKRLVEIDVTLRFVVPVPRNWDRDMIEYHFQQGGGVANHLFDFLPQLEHDGLCEVVARQREQKHLRQEDRPGESWNVTGDIRFVREVEPRPNSNASQEA